MVLRAGLPPTPALIVPDEQTWTMAGSDPALRGLRPVFSLGAARAALVPDSLPVALAEALRLCLCGLSADVDVEARALPVLDGLPGSVMFERVEAGVTVAHAGAPHDAHGGHDMGHGHGDMMAIVGEPSADGLVMEPIELRFGPLGTPLPGGLAVDVTLDGDVVADGKVEALPSVDPPTNGAPAPPDPLAPLAWRVALHAARDEGRPDASWRRLAALEIERALSHLAWLRALGRLLGWSTLVDRCSRGLDGLADLAHGLVRRGVERGEDDAPPFSALERAAEGPDAVAGFVEHNRWLRLRAAGIGVVGGEQARRAGLRGPVARASGLEEDARSGDARYERLGFEPVLDSGGDAYARILVRAREAREGLRLAAAALRADSEGAPVASPPAGGAVEGPRGPLLARRQATAWLLEAPGSAQALRMAGEAMRGAEWADALVALASFDLSPWTVGT